MLRQERLVLLKVLAFRLGKVGESFGRGENVKGVFIDLDKSIKQKLRLKSAHAAFV